MNQPTSDTHSTDKLDGKLDSKLDNKLDSKLSGKLGARAALIHPTAIIHPDAKIDPSVQIGPWCTIGPHVRLGKGTQLISHVVVEGWTQIGENNVFFPFSVVGAIPQDLKYNGEPTQLIIGNDNTFRESVTLNLGTVKGGGVTRIGNNCLVMAYTHIGHDCIVGNHCIIANYGGLAGHVVLDDYVTMGGQCGVTQYCRLGSYSYIAGQSAIERDVPPFSIAIGGRPCVLKGTNIVGLRRRGFAADTIQKINESIKLWVRPEVPREQSLLQIESQYGETREVQQFIAFIRSSETGVLR